MVNMDEKLILIVFSPKRSFLLSFGLELAYVNLVLRYIYLSFIHQTLYCVFSVPFGEPALSRVYRTIQYKLMYYYIDRCLSVITLEIIKIRGEYEWNVHSLSFSYFYSTTIISLWNLWRLFLKGCNNENCIPLILAPWRHVTRPTEVKKNKKNKPK